MKLEVEVIEKLKQIKGDRDWNELMKDLLEGEFENTGRAEDGRDEGKMAGDGGLSMSKGVAQEIEKPSPVHTGTRYVPARIKRHVIEKTGGLCAYPGCGKPYEILHHTKRFALDATHDPSTLKPLCKAHERLAHGGMIENEEVEPVGFPARDGEFGDKVEVKINWTLRTAVDESAPKYMVDKKVNEFYMPK